ncbi:uncharacterized protein [Ranitomeya imitator]|uniref:uncharacterized protein isoform X2 n=1 Tax=Ranitomeya imitator TaxID=111125 RepID=UPI0037E93922
MVEVIPKKPFKLVFFCYVIICVFTETIFEEMDFREREKAWLNQLDQVFNEGAGSTADFRPGDTSILTSKYKELLHKRTRLWWNKAFLERYMGCELVPRGLRVQVFPSFVVNDNDFIQQWEDAASACSKKFMELLAKHNEKQLKELDDELNVIQEEINKCLTGEAKTKFKDEMDSSLKKWETEVVQNKTKKYQRDVSDRQQGQIYKWYNRRLFNKTNPRGRSISFSSVSSAEDRTSRAENSRPFWTKKDQERNEWRNGRLRNKRKMDTSPVKDKKMKSNVLEH